MFYVRDEIFDQFVYFCIFVHVNLWTIKIIIIELSITNASGQICPAGLSK